ncbi:MAG TPA: DUF4337 family protein [Chloroflexota bacterium]|jgi:hypothetical protein|nr:DUF4337 family protein [Chloroflexota bacterium]
MAANELSPSGSAEHLRHTAIGHGDGSSDFRTRAAVALAVLAVLLALCNLGGENARKRAIIDSVHASDVSISHESAVVRQLQLQLNATTLDAIAALSPAAADSPARAQVQQTIGQERDAVAHPPAADPSNHGPAILTEGESITALESEIRGYEADRDRAEVQNENYEVGTALLEIGLVLGSVAIVALSRWLLGLSFVAGGLGVLFALNGLLLVVGLF